MTKINKKELKARLNEMKFVKDYHYKLINITIELKHQWAYLSYLNQHNEVTTLWITWHHEKPSIHTVKGTVTYLALKKLDLELSMYLDYTQLV